MKKNDPKYLNMLQYRPVMSVLMPVYNTEPEILEKALNSVLRQAYKKWELCIVDDASDNVNIRLILEKYAKKSRSIRIMFSDKNEGIAATINKAAGMANGEYIGVLDHDDELDPFLLLEYVRTLNTHPDADCVYCDEDKIDEQGNCCDPWFKSDWNPDLSLSFNYVM
ncbi:MAG: glycosyltransferase family 2 protein, partial [Deltaproteobacteria bacterium]